MGYGGCIATNENVMVKKEEEPLHGFGNTGLHFEESVRHALIQVVGKIN